MTIKELIQELQKYDENREVVISADGVWSSIDTVEELVDGGIIITD